MPAKTRSVTDFLATLPDDRRRTVKALRAVIRKNIDKPFKESVQGDMLSWSLPHSVYPEGYHCNPEQPLPFAAIASQKIAASTAFEAAALLEPRSTAALPLFRQSAAASIVTLGRAS